MNNQTDSINLKQYEYENELSKLNSWAVAALMGMCSLAACSDDNSGEGGGNGDSEEVIANNGTLKGSVDGSKTVILTKGYNFSSTENISSKPVPP